MDLITLTERLKKLRKAIDDSRIRCEAEVPSSQKRRHTIGVCRGLEEALEIIDGDTEGAAQ